LIELVLGNWLLSLFGLAFFAVWGSIIVKPIWVGRDIIDLILVEVNCDGSGSLSSAGVN
jgi:hypothetical protein